MYDIIRHMKRTTMFFPEALEAELRAYARGENKPVAWVVREAVSAYLAQNGKPFALPAIVGKYASGRSDLSERINREGFGEASPHGDRPKKRPKRSRRA
jgi:hypothetical protein